MTGEWMKPMVVVRAELPGVRTCIASPVFVRKKKTGDNLPFIYIFKMLPSAYLMF